MIIDLRKKTYTDQRQGNKIYYNIGLNQTSFVA